MKIAPDSFLNKTQLITTLILCMLSIPMLSFGQKNEKPKFEIVVNCVEYAGNGKFKAHFGYDNPGKKTITVDESNSTVIYNRGQSKKLGINTFQPGVVEKAFSKEFGPHDRVQWEVILPDGTVKQTTDASVNSSHFCQGNEFITPYYEPPTGGKINASLIGAELTSLYNKSIIDGNNFSPKSDDIFQIDESLNVLIVVVSKNNKATELVTELNALVLGISDEGDFSYNRASYWFPIDQLIYLNDFTYLNFARPVFTGIPNFIPGQGDKSMLSDYTRLGFSSDQFMLDGSGVRVGVISNSYDTKRTADLDVDQEDLPGADNDYGYNNKVEVLADIQTPVEFPLSDEGRAMAQIVHDVAPGAELVFRTGYLGELDMAQGISDLADPGDPVTGKCDIIVDDITYITEPFFRDGIISQAIDIVVTRQSNPVTYISAAGNFGSYSYQSVFQSGNPIPGVTEETHNFGDINMHDNLQRINLAAGTYTLVLQWDDGTDPDFQAVTETDLDIYLTNNDVSTRLGFNRVNTGGAPVEVVPFTVTQDNVLANILITRESGPDRPVAIKYVVFRGGFGFDIQEYGQGSSTIVGHPNAAGTIAVGAVRYDQTPAGESSPIVVEDFSSVGGTPIMTYTAGSGTPQTNFIIRNKPDFTAPDGVNTSVNLSTEGDSDYDGDLLPNFFGTSAAAPHAAGAAALILQARKLFDQGNSSLPEDTRTLMCTTAIGNNDEFDMISGHGFIQPYRAIKTFANPRPEIDALIPPDGTSPGETLEPISFTVKGNFFIEDDGNPERETTILFRGEELTTGVVIVDEQTIQIENLSFLGNPEIQAMNPSISAGPEVDGGVSNSFYFSTVPKKDVTITAQSFQKYFGESLPNFSSVILSDGSDSEVFYNASIDYTDFATGELDRILARLSFDVKATATSGVAIYDINLILSEPETPTELDHAIAEKYNISLVGGHLRVDKLALKITPMPVDLTYGHILTQDMIDFNYELESDNITPEDKVTILADLSRNYTDPLPIGVPLLNGVTLVRGIAMVNAENGVNIEINVSIDGTIQYKENGVPYTSAAALPRGIAMVNGLPFVQIEDIIDGDGKFYEEVVGDDRPLHGDIITFKREGGVSYMTALNGDPILDEQDVPIRIAVENSMALVRGIAMVNGVEVEVKEISGEFITYINNAAVTARGIAMVNGIPLIRGIAMVNSEFIRGIAMVNGIEIPVMNGIPDVSGQQTNSRGIAMVNGIAMVDGIISILDMNVIIEDGLIDESSIPTDPVIVNGIPVSRGIAMVNGLANVRGIAMVNGQPAIRGIAMVNGSNLVRGIAMVNDVPADLNLNNMNFLASTNALSSMTFVNGREIVSDLSGIDGEKLAIAAVIPSEDLEVVNYYSDVRGIAMVNGHALARGIAMVNGLPLVRGIAMVNENTISEVSNLGAIMINYGAEEPASYIPVTFITGTDAGTHSIVPGTFLSNNFNISYGLGALNIAPAELEITAAASQSKTYGHEDPTLLIGSYILDDVLNDNPYEMDGKVLLYGNDELTVSLSREEGEDVGSYPIEGEGLDAGDNYNITFVPGVFFTIEKATLTVEADNVVKSYGEDDPPLTYQVTTGSLIPGDEITGSLLRATGENAGSYTIGQGTLNAGSNYNFTVIEGTFYINPYGPGTKAIKPVLNCVVYQEDDGTYIANFEYKNDNDADYFIPVGEDNVFEVVGDGSIEFYDPYPDMVESQPTLFLKDGGEFQVKFSSEVEIRWILTSVNKNQKSSNATSASSSSTKCTGNLKSATVTSEVEEELLDPDLLMAYPNPVTNKVHITMKNIEIYKMIILYDFTGRSHPITSIDKRSDQLEIDMAQLSPGHYFIRIEMEDTTRVVPIIKQ